MNIQQKVNEFQEATKAIMYNSPYLVQMEWQINDLEYANFKEFADAVNKQPTIHGKKMFFIYNIDSCQVVLWTKELEIVTSVTVNN